MSRNRLQKNSWLNVPAWIVLGAGLVLAPIFVFMTLESIHRQKANTTELLVEKGAALIRSFEAGARTGMMGMRWGGTQVQRLLMETAQQPDIVYLLVTDRHGKILADNNPEEVGKTHGTELDLDRIACSQHVEWRHVVGPNGSNIFEVFRAFSPTRGLPQGFRGGMRRGMASGDWCQPHLDAETASDNTGQVIFVGLDMAPVEAARTEDTRHTVVMALVFLLVGFAGIVSLFLAQAYRSSQTSLSRVKAFSDSLVENMPIGLVATDTEGRIASFNQAAESVLQLASRDVLLRNPSEVLPDVFSGLLDRLKNGENLVEAEVGCPLSEGKSIPLEVVATSLREENGSFLGYVLLFRDLTEIQHLKEEVARSQRLASIGRLAAGVAHEIRNPLSSIKGFATYFKERYREIPQDQKTAEIMIQEVERLNRVIGQLLEFARPMHIEKKPTSLGLLIEHSLKLIEADAQAKDIRLVTKLAPDPGHVMLDPDHIKQVLLNLYLNAMEAMENGGVLSVELIRDRRERALRISISDTGLGIKEEDLAHIFDPYYTTKSSGTGLGLAIAHKIIESHGGELRIRSKPGAGTTVTIFLPFSEEV